MDNQMVYQTIIALKLSHIAYILIYRVILLDVNDLQMKIFCRFNWLFNIQI